MNKIFEELDLAKENPGGFCGEWVANGSTADIISPINGGEIAKVRQITGEDYQKISKAAHNAFLDWREIPAPKRGDVVRQVANELRESIRGTRHARNGKIDSGGLWRSTGNDRYL